MPDWEVRYYSKDDLDRRGKEGARICVKVVSAKKESMAGAVVKAEVWAEDRMFIELFSIKQVGNQNKGGE